MTNDRALNRLDVERWRREGRWFAAVSARRIKKMKTVTIPQISLVRTIVASEKSLSSKWVMRKILYWSLLVLETSLPEAGLERPSLRLAGSER